MISQTGDPMQTRQQRLLDRTAYVGGCIAATIALTLWGGRLWRHSDAYLPFARSLSVDRLAAACGWLLFLRPWQCKLLLSDIVLLPITATVAILIFSLATRLGVVLGRRDAWRDARRRHETILRMLETSMDTPQRRVGRPDIGRVLGRVLCFFVLTATLGSLWFSVLLHIAVADRPSSGGWTATQVGPAGWQHPQLGVLAYVMVAPFVLLAVTKPFRGKRRAAIVPRLESEVRARLDRHR